MSVRVRFAPSPTGFLHVGGARTALYNYLFARGLGGRFILRIEDTDAARSNEESVAAILSSLRWLGLTWDEGPGADGASGPYFQSERRALYGRHAETLRASGAAYPCFCAPSDLEARRSADGAPGASREADPCRALSRAERDRRVSAREPFALRFANDGLGESAWDDIVRGRVSFRNDLLEDFVLLRSDGFPTYNFACVVDDFEMKISHVVRGDDHISNTPRQLLLDRAFGWTPPRFAHVPMILGADGSRLSKRHGATSVEAFRELGIVPEALVNFLALLGWAYDGQQEIFDLPELESKFSLERVGANPSIFNLEKLEWMNGKHLARLAEDERTRRVEAFLAARGFDLSARDPGWRRFFVRAIGDRLKTLADAETYGRFALVDTIEPDPSAWHEIVAIAAAAERLEALAGALSRVDPFELEAVEREIRELAAVLQVKAGELIRLARVALTGSKASVGIFEAIVLLGRDRTLSRLLDAARRWRESQAPAHPAGG